MRRNFLGQKYFLCLIGLFISFIPVMTLAQSPLQLVVIEPIAKIRTAPSDSARILGRLKEGRRLQSTGKKDNGFYQIETKSGRRLWVSAEEVREDTYNLEADLAEPAAFEKPSTPSEPQPQDRDFTRLTYDLNISTGQSADINYTEANLGLSFFFTPWLAWRNGIFGRLYRDSEFNTLYGLDSSLRGLFGADLDRGTGIRLFGGPGYRFVNEGKDVPFLEAGLVLRLAGLAIGGGVKTLYNQAVDNNLENDTQYFLILSGSGQL